MRVFKPWVRSGRSLPPCGLLSLLLLLGLATGAQAQVDECTTANADGSYDVPNNWALKPSGLADGTKFRLLFLTSTRHNAASTDIASYNTIVQTRAKAGHAAITDSCGNLFKVVGSTASVNARANTDSESTDTDAAIYWLDGAKVADNYADFYDNSWDSRTAKSESGVTISASFNTWTGINSDGTTHSNPLGSTTPRIGTLALGITSPLSQVNAAGNTVNGRFYALSPIFNVFPPNITITGGSAVTEGTTIFFTVTANPAPSAALSATVSVADDDTADFVTSSREGNKALTVPTSGSDIFSVVTSGDTNDEPDGEVTMSFVSASGYVAGSPSSASVVVKDNDPTVVTLSRVGTGGIAEGGKVEFTVRLGRALIAGEIIDVPLSVTGTGVTASDWSIGRKSGSGLNTGVTLRTGNVVRFSGAGARTATLELTAAADSVDESTETFIVALRSNAIFDAGTLGTNVGGGADPDLNMYLFNVAVSNFITPALSLPADPSSTAEGDAGKFVLAREFTLTRRPKAGETLTFQVCVRGTATPGEDYRIRGPQGEGVRGGGCTGTRNIGPQISATTFKYRLEVRGDREVEQDETVEVYLKDPTQSPRLSYANGKFSGRFTHTIANDDDGSPAVTVTAGNGVTEGGAATFTLTADPAPTSPLSVSVTVSQSGDYAASGATGTKTVTVPTTGSATYSVATVDDSTDEADGSVTVAVSGGNGYTAGSPSSATVVVNDNDLPTVTITGGSTVTEGTGAEFTVTRTGATTGALTVLLAVSENTASGRDFVASSNEGNKEVTIPSNQASATYTVATVADTTDEPNGAVTVALRNSSAYTSGSPSSATVTVNDNDLPTVTITAGGGVTEGQNASFTVTRTGAMTEALTVLLAVSENTSSGQDFVASGNQGNKQVIIPSNSASATYTVDTVADTTDEANGEVTVALRSSSAYTSGSPSSATVNVSDNDSSDGGGGGGGGGGGSTTPTASFASGSQSVAEDVGTQNVQVTLNPAPTTGITLSYGVGGTATSGSGNDFTIAGSGSVSVPSGATSVSIPVAIEDDSVAESSETVVLTLTSGGGYTLGSPLVHTLTITDNDGSGGGGGSRGLTFSPSGLTVAEGGSGVYRVMLSTEPTDTVTVAITSDNGEVTFSPASLTFNASGSNLWSVAQPVTVFADQDPDTNDDSATLRHTASGGGYDSVSGMVNVSVIDGDTPPVVSITSASPISEGDVAHFTLSATPPPGDPISVSVSISDSGNVVSPGESGSRSVTIAASGTASFTVSTQEDDVYEEDGRITATVAAGSGYRPHGSNASAVVIVEDDDPGLDVSQPSLSVPEGGSTSYTMALATQPTGEVTVTVSVSGGEGTGLTIDPDQLIFTPSNWDKQQRVTVTAAENAATGRTITLSHRASGGGYDGIPLSDVMVRVVSAHPAAAVGGWQLRFGRTVSQQVVDALQQRWSTPSAGQHLTVAGETVSSSTPPLAENAEALSKALGFDPLTLQQVVEDSSFTIAPQPEIETEEEAEAEEGAPQLAVWGQGALSSFKGEGNGLSSLNGDVTTLLLGADWSTTRWQAGAALSQSWGTGSYAADGGADGDMSSSLTGLFPYGRYGLTPRLAIWAVAGYGWGQLSLQPDGGDEDYKPTTTMGMAALGMDGLLLDGGKEGISLTSTAELLTLKTTSAEVEGLDASEGSVSRLRLGLEAARAFPLANGASLLPTMAVGIRQDDGDAETGFGMDLGAGMVWNDPGRGIRGEVKGRTLLTHREESFQEQGMAISFSWDPTPSNRGPSLSLSHTMGATGSEGMDALLESTTMEDAAPSSDGQQEFAAEVAYGFPAHKDRLTLTPAVALALSSTSRNYSLLWSLAPYAEQSPQTPPWEVALEGERQEQHSPTAAVHHSLKLTFSSLF